MLNGWFCRGCFLIHEGCCEPQREHTASAPQPTGSSLCAVLPTVTQGREMSTDGGLACHSVVVIYCFQCFQNTRCVLYFKWSVFKPLN